MAPTKRVDNEKCKLPPVQNGRVEKKMSPAKAGGGRPRKSRGMFKHSEIGQYWVFRTGMSRLRRTRIEVRTSLANEVTARQPIPSETLLEALLYLNRGQLEAVQLTSARFRTIVEENMTGVCLRPINEVRVSAYNEQVDVELKSGASKAFMSIELAGQTQNAQAGPSGSPEDAQGPLVPHLRNTVVLGRFMVCDCHLTPPILDAFRGIVKK
ncbi:hypothetical protein AAVH_24627 [Aphelenchoides avenae]|nr:hypothetical protein AAVH_24627 [Aphelenchus avenae]